MEGIGEAMIIPAKLKAIRKLIKNLEIRFRFQIPKKRVARGRARSKRPSRD